MYTLRLLDMGDPMGGEGGGHDPPDFQSQEQHHRRHHWRCASRCGSGGTKERINAMHAIINISTNFDVGVSFVV